MAKKKFKPLTKPAEPHNWSGQIFHWRYCVKCLHVLLKNDVSQREISKACPDDRW